MSFPMMWWNDGGPGWGGGWFAMTLMMLVFWGVLIAVGVAVWRAVTRDEQHDKPLPMGDPAAPLRLLDERFARGEIDEADYTRRRELLRTLT